MHVSNACSAQCYIYNIIYYRNIRGENPLYNVHVHICTRIINPPTQHVTVIPTYTCICSCMSIHKYTCTCIYTYTVCDCFHTTVLPPYSVFSVCCYKNGGSDILVSMG